MKSILALIVIIVPALVIPTVVQCDLTVHEWGTFTSVAGADGAAIDWDALGCQSDLPKFVHDNGFRGGKRWLRGTVRMETPVLYFYSPEEMQADVKVSFPRGLITEWYPKADYQVLKNGRELPANLSGIDTTLQMLTGAIAWKGIKIQPGATPNLPVEKAPSRYYAARGTDAAAIAVNGQQEKFLFYRGVGRFPVPISARVLANGTTVVENSNQEAIPSVILFENRAGYIGYRTVGSVKTSQTIESPKLDGTLPQLREELKATLAAQGLYPKEAQAMIDTWQDSWFEEGSRVIYIVPSAAVNAILPLDVTPTPSRIARVFVGRIELVTPATMQTVELAVAKNDWQAVGRYSRFLDPILHRLYGDNWQRIGDVEQRFQTSPSGCRANR